MSRGWQRVDFMVAGDEAEALCDALADRGAIAPEVSDAHEGTQHGQPLFGEPGAAVGAGSHPSTRLCLARLEREVRPGDRVLDYGCGSGILGIAALKRGAARAVAVDIDPLALEAARYNAGRNAVMLQVCDA